jgi:wyosine [tRNA(Phe)-imidazoG37] synthetase (radical SAM superfamily)
MATFLFDEIIFGPVKSRRLGASLGINLLPNDKKICSFDCIYCECGWTHSESNTTFHPREEVRENLRLKLEEMKINNQPLDTITFAGNGEPTLHPHFDLIIQDTIGIRNRYFPEAQIAVLSNSSLIHKRKIFTALKRVDQNILKLDSAFPETVELMNQPYPGFNFERMVENLKKFDGQLIIQTMFIRGEYNGKKYDNTTDREITAWLQLLKEIKPAMVMIYTIARDTPAEGIERIEKDELDVIAQKVEDIGIPTQISS